MKTLEIQGQRVKLQIWDTAGQERFCTITQSYYLSANGAILAYDITKRSSFLSVPHWIEDVRKYAGSSIVQLLIGEAGRTASVRLLCERRVGGAWPGRRRARTWTPSRRCGCCWSPVRLHIPEREPGAGPAGRHHEAAPWPTLVPFSSGIFSEPCLPLLCQGRAEK